MTLCIPASSNQNVIIVLHQHATVASQGCVSAATKRRRTHAKVTPMPDGAKAHVQFPQGLGKLINATRARRSSHAALKIQDQGRSNPPSD